MAKMHAPRRECNLLLPRNAGRERSKGNNTFFFPISPTPVKVRARSRFSGLVRAKARGEQQSKPRCREAKEFPWRQSAC